MKIASILLLSLCLLTPLVAQNMEPPEALDDEMMNWLVGEWEGSYVSPMGTSKDWMKYEYGLDKQFLFIQGTSETAAMNYKGMGAMTIDSQGNVVGDWIDNLRGRYNGKGTKAGNVVTLEWDGTSGKSTRITEKLDENKLRVAVKMPGPDGTMMEYTGEFTRKPMMTEKN